MILSFCFLLLNSVYTVLPLSRGIDRVKGGTIQIKTVRYIHTYITRFGKSGVGSSTAHGNDTGCSAYV